MSPVQAMHQTPRAGQEQCSHPSSLPPRHSCLPRMECLLLGWALVSSRDERGLPALRMTSCFLPGLLGPEQIEFALFFWLLGNMSFPVPAQACVGDRDRQLGRPLAGEDLGCILNCRPKRTNCSGFRSYCSWEKTAEMERWSTGRGEELWMFYVG